VDSKPTRAEALAIVMDRNRQAELKAARILLDLTVSKAVSIRDCGYKDWEDVARSLATDIRAAYQDGDDYLNALGYLEDEE
jgi:hypothetical protein